MGGHVPQRARDIFFFKQKTAYDIFAMNIMLFQAYNQKHDMDSAVPVLAAAAQSQYATSDQKKVWLKNIALYYFQEKDYNKALDAANEAVKTGLNDSEMLNLIAKSQYLLGKYKESAATMQEVVNKQEKPDEES